MHMVWIVFIKNMTNDIWYPCSIYCVGETYNGKSAFKTAREKCFKLRSKFEFHNVKAKKCFITEI
jgi:hypothetical protein